MRTTAVHTTTGTLGPRVHLDKAESGPNHRAAAIVGISRSVGVQVQKSTNDVEYSTRQLTSSVACQLLSSNSQHYLKRMESFRGKHTLLSRGQVWATHLCIATRASRGLPLEVAPPLAEATRNAPKAQRRASPPLRVAHGTPEHVRSTDGRRVYIYFRHVLCSRARKFTVPLTRRARPRRATPVCIHALKVQAQGV